VDGIRWLAVAALAPRAAILALVLAPSPLLGQQGARVVEVRVEQEGREVGDPLVHDLIQTRPGSPLSPVDVRETIAHLNALDRYDDVRVLEEPVPGGVRLRYILLPLHPVDRVEFRGEPGVDVGDLRRVVADRFGPAPTAGRADEVADAVKGALRNRGYPAAEVRARIEETHQPDRATMVLEIASGRRVSIRDVTFRRIDQGGAAVARMPDVRPGQPYDEQTIVGALTDWEDAMLASRHYGARASHSVAFGDAGADVVVSLEAGPQVRVEFAAGDPLPEAERARLVLAPIQAERSVDEDLLEDASRAMQAFWLARGYKDARADWERDERGGALTIRFRTSRGERSVVGAVVITGSTVPEAEVRAALGLKDRTPFVQAALEAGVASLETFYRRRGNAGARVTHAIAELPPGPEAGGDRLIEVRITVAEGPRTRLASVAFQGRTVVAEESLRKLIGAAPGRPYVRAELDDDRQAIEATYRDLGYDAVVAEPRASLSADGTEAAVVFVIREGERVVVDRTIVVGNVRTSRATIERELQLARGQPLGPSALANARTRLLALGLFRRVQIEVVPHGSEPRRDLLVRVEEAPPTTYGFGGGLEGGFRLRPTGEGGAGEERFELAPRGFFQIGRRNLWGKNRAIDLFTRVSLKSRDIATGASDPQVPPGEGGYGFNEYRIVGTFREPRLFGSGAEALATGIFEQGIRTSFNFVRREARAEAGLRLAPTYSVLGRYSFQRTKLLDERFAPSEKPLIDRLFPEVRLSRFAGSLIHDSRDDPLDASSGMFLTVDLDVASRAIGSEVGFVRTQVQGSIFRRLPVGRRTVLGAAARVGAAHGFSREVDGEIVQDLPASERFFAGGETSVRGFSLERLGDERTIPASGFPTGGNGVVVLMSEVRVALSGRFEGVGFLDAGNVFPNASDVDLTELRPAAGVGVRVRLPRLPLLRVDWGFNLDPREFAPGVRERGNVWHVSFGQAF
jgi:outer membrane protein insertion porin family